MAGQYTMARWFTKVLTVLYVRAFSRLRAATESIGKKN
jgi:hypothetical protein